LLIDLTIDQSLIAPSLRLAVPTWVPGDYEFMPFVRDLFELTGRDSQTGLELTVQRDG